MKKLDAATLSINQARQVAKVIQEAPETANRDCKSSENTSNNTFYSQYVTTSEYINLNFTWINNIILLGKIKKIVRLLF